jgi:hypothetical protein
MDLSCLLNQINRPVGVGKQTTRLHLSERQDKRTNSRETRRTTHITQAALNT